MACYLREKNKWRVQEHLWIFPYIYAHNIERCSQGDGQQHQRVQERVLDFGQDGIAFRHIWVELFDIETADPAIKVAVAHQDGKAVTTVIVEYFN